MKGNETIDLEKCKCGKKTAKNAVRVRCVNCSRYYHPTCANPGFANINRTSLTTVVSSWWCVQCVVNKDIESGNQEVINSLTTKLVPLLETRLNESIDSRVSRLNEEVESTIESKIVAALKSFFPNGPHSPIKRPNRSSLLLELW